MTWFRDRFDDVQSSKIKFILFLLLCCLFAAFAGHSAFLETPTVDEYQELPAGLHYWKTADFELEGGNPPLAKLWASLPLLFRSHVVSPDYRPHGDGSDPLEYGRTFEKANSEAYLDMFFAGRLMIIVLTIFTAVLIYIAASKIDSEFSGLFVAGLFLMSPTALAHGHLATCDMACTLTLFASWFAFRFFPPTVKREWLQILITGFLFGLAVGTKFTAILLFPFFFIWIGIAYRTRRRKPRQLFGNLFLFTATVVVAICSCYGFQNLGQTWPELALRSSRMLSLPVPVWLPIPLPAAFIHGIDGKFSTYAGGGFQNYLLGEWSEHGFPAYYIIAFCLKESVMTILAVAAGILCALRRRAAWILILPFAIILASLSVGNPQQLGIRYLLPAYPFLFVLVVYAVRDFPMSRVIASLVLASAVATAAISSPNYLGYFNFASLALANNNDLKLLADSNLDWGQDLYLVPQILKDHLVSAPVALMYWGETSPANYGIRYYLPDEKSLQPGIVIISANFLTGYDYFTPTPSGQFVWIETQKWQWLQKLKFAERRGSLFVFKYEIGRP